MKWQSDREIDRDVEKHFEDLTDGFYTVGNKTFKFGTGRKGVIEFHKILLKGIRNDHFAPNLTLQTGKGHSPFLDEMIDLITQIGKQ